MKIPDIRKLRMIGDDFVKLKIVLTEEERRGLERLADEQLRAPWEQVRWIIRQELICRGILSGEKTEDVDERDE